MFCAKAVYCYLGKRVHRVPQPCSLGRSWVARAIKGSGRFLCLALIFTGTPWIEEEICSLLGAVSRGLAFSVSAVTKGTMCGHLNYYRSET